MRGRRAVSAGHGRQIARPPRAFVAARWLELLFWLFWLFSYPVQERRFEDGFACAGMLLGRIVNCHSPCRLRFASGRWISLDSTGLRTARRGTGWLGFRRAIARDADPIGFEFANGSLERQALLGDLGTGERRFMRAQLLEQRRPRASIQRTARFPGVGVETGDHSSEELIIIAHSARLPRGGGRMLHAKQTTANPAAAPSAERAAVRTDLSARAERRRGRIPLP